MAHVIGRGRKTPSRPREHWHADISNGVMKWRASCCPVPPEPRLTVLNHQGLSLGQSHRLRGETCLSIVVIGNYSEWPDIGGTMPSKSKPFRLPVEPISPPSTAHTGRLVETAHGQMVEAPGTAPGSRKRITTAFITIAGRIRQAEYRRGDDKMKGPLYPGAQGRP